MIFCNSKPIANPVLNSTTPTHETFIKVPFFDVDSMNIAWHGHYVKYFEIARCELLDDIGYNYMAMAESGFAFPIVELNIKYVRPLRFEQMIRIVSTIKEWEYRLKIQYQIYDAASGEKLTSGHTVQAAVDTQTQQLRLECPSILGEKIAAKISQP